MKTISLSILFLTVAFSSLSAQIVGNAGVSMPIDSTQKAAVNQIEQPKEHDEIPYSSINFGIGFGYGFKAGHDFGVNIRAGYSTGGRLYLGGVFNYHFGRSLSQNFDSLFVSLETYGYSVAGEVGYDFVVEKKALLRPSIAVGLITFKEVGQISEPKNQKELYKKDESTSHLLVSPGMLLQFPITKDIFWGAELRYNVVTGDGDFNALGLLTNFLFRF